MDIWRIVATAYMLATGRKELRKALAEVVREAVARGWVDAGKAEGWLEKLEKGLTLKEGWPKYEIGLSGSGALVVRSAPPAPTAYSRRHSNLGRWGLRKAGTSP